MQTGSYKVLHIFRLFPSIDRTNSACGCYLSDQEWRKYHKSGADNS